MLNRNELEIFYNETFKTDLKPGKWNSANNPYKKFWYPLQFPVSTRDKSDSKMCRLGTENIKIENQTMTLTATDNGKEYCGTELRTKELYLYGYFEIKARLKTSAGICPAFWLLSEENSNNAVAYEADVFECFDNLVGGALIGHKALTPDWSHRTTFGGFKLERITDEPSPVKDFQSVQQFFKGNWREEYHIFGFDWKPDALTWYIDDVPVMSAALPEYEPGKRHFCLPMRVILTQYSGVNVWPLGETVSQKTDWENGNSMAIEYIRFYSHKQVL